MNLPGGITLNDISILIRFLIMILPSLIFVSIVFTRTVRGVKRGYRKSMILFIQSIILFAIFLGLYLLICETTFGDELLLSIVNIFFGGAGGLQRYLGVSEDIVLLREVLILGLPEQLNLVDNLAYYLSIAVDGSGAYLELLVNYIYHLLFATVFFILYIFFDFILYLLYAIFYNNRKAKRRHNRKFENGNEFNSFTKNRLGGGLVGFTRGVLRGVIAISFIGAFFFILSGDDGSGTLKNVNLGNVEANQVYEMYQMVDGYGSKGVIKVLNNFKDEEDGPIYLIFADTINSGKIQKANPETGEIEEYKLNLRQGVSSYTSLAKELVNILSVHAEEAVRDYFNGDIDQNELLGIAQDLLLSDPDFQLDILELFDKLPTNTYTINFALSLVDNAAKSIDQIELDLPEEVREPLYIAFVEGYYSDYIPEEKALKEAGCEEELPYISILSLINRDDIRTIAELALAYMNMSVNFEDFGSDDDMIPFIKTAVQYIEELSLFTTSRKEEINAVLGRLYKYAENKYLSDEELFAVSNRENNDVLMMLSNTSYQKDYEDYLNSIKSDVNWIGEVEKLLDASIGVVKLIKNSAKLHEETQIAAFLGLFSKENPDYDENMKTIDSLLSLIYDSDILGSVLSSKSFYGAIRNGLSEILPVYEYPEDVVYTNKYDENGNRVSTGELYYFLKAARLIITDMPKDLIDGLSGKNDLEMGEYLTLFADALRVTDQENNFSISDYIVESRILETFISAYVIDLSNEDDSMIYITKQSLEIDEDGNYTMVIKKDMLKELLDLIPELIDGNDENSVWSIIEPLTQEEDLDNKDILKIVDKVLNSPIINQLLNNKILQGILGRVLSTVLSENDFISLPKDLKDPENWVATDTKESEIILLLNAIRTLNIDFSTIMNDEESSVIDNVFNSLVETYKNGTLKTILDSDILYYTLSNTLSSYTFSSSFKIIIPYAARNMLEDDSLDYVIKREELVNLFSCIMDLLGLGNGGSIDKLSDSFSDFNGILDNVISTKDKQLSCLTISASLAYTINKAISDNEVGSFSITVPRDLKEDGTEEALVYYTNKNGWYNELGALFDALNEIFHGSINLEDGDVGSNIINLFAEGGYLEPSTTNSEKTLIDLMYDSRIISSTLTGAIDTYLTESIIDPQVKERAKNNNIYDKDELVSILELLTEYNILSLSSAHEFDTSTFKPIPDFDNPARNFYLVRGLLSKAVERFIYDEENNPTGLLYSHPLAYESPTFKIFKKSEFNAIFDILNNTDITHWNPTDFEFSKYLDFIYDENGETKSYIIVSTISKKIVEIEGLVIPTSALDSRVQKSLKIISPIELRKLLDVLGNMLESNMSISSFGIDSIDIGIGLFESEIMNATICKNLNFSSGSGESQISTYVLETRAVSTFDLNGNKIFYLRKEEYQALVDVINVVFDSGSLSQGVSIDWLTNLDETKLNALLECSITNIMVSDMIINNGFLSYYNTAIDNAFLLTLMGLPTLTGSKILNQDIGQYPVYKFATAQREAKHQILSAAQITAIWQNLAKINQVKDSLPI